MRRLEIHPAFVALSCFLFYFMPTVLFCSYAALVVMHELGHLVALMILNVKISRIRLGMFGAVIETAPMAPWAEAISAFAGPAVNLFCAWALFPCLPIAALISLLLACYNLLPIHPLDGGRILRAILSMCLPLQLADLIEKAVAAIFFLAIGLAVVRAGSAFGLLPIGFFLLLLAHVVFDANSCCQVGRFSL